MKTITIFLNSSSLKPGIRFLTVIIALLSLNQLVITQTKENKVIFSSQYTKIQNCKSGMTKEEENRLAKSAMDEGQDPASTCIGYGNYEIFTGIHGCGGQFQVRVRSESRVKDVVVAEDLDYKEPIYKRNIEWRMANGEPFAVIFRRNVYAKTDDPCMRKKTGEVIRVIGLTDKNINFTINPVKTKNANAVARRMADRSFSAPTAKTNGQKQ